MNMKALLLSAMTTVVIVGGAYAAGEGKTTALDEPTKMQPFYTDSGMKTLKGADDFKAAWMAMTPGDRDVMMSACADELADANPTNTHPEFCSNVKALGGEKSGN